jgi:hypothetical protein
MSGHSAASRDLPQRPSSRAVPVAWSSPRWRLRVPVQDGFLEVRAGRPSPRAVADPYDLAGRCGTGAFSLSLPLKLVQTLLTGVPGGIDVAGLDPEDAALVAEHVLTRPIEMLEGLLGAPVILQRLEPRAAGQDMAAIHLIAKVQAGEFPIGLTIEDAAAFAAMSAAIARLDARGPGVVPGMPIGLGPIRISRADMAAIQPGDQLLLNGATPETLTGILFLDDTLGWPIRIVDGAVEATGPLGPAADAMEALRSGMASLFLRVGVSAGQSPMQLADRVPMQRLEDSQMLVSSGTRILGQGALVSLPEGLAVRFVAEARA